MRTDGQLERSLDSHAFKERREERDLSAARQGDARLHGA